MRKILFISLTPTDCYTSNAIGTRVTHARVGENQRRLTAFLISAPAHAARGAPACHNGGIPIRYPHPVAPLSIHNSRKDGVYAAVELHLTANPATYEGIISWGGIIFFTRR